MASYGICKLCAALVWTGNFDAHRKFHKGIDDRDPGPHGYHEAGLGS